MPYSDYKKNADTWKSSVGKIKGDSIMLCDGEARQEFQDHPREQKMALVLLLLKDCQM